MARTVLGRLAEDGLARVEGHVASTEGAARKYYRLTPEGEAELEGLTGAFLGFARAVEGIVGDETGGRRA